MAGVLVKSHLPRLYTVKELLIKPVIKVTSWHYLKKKALKRGSICLMVVKVL